MSSKIINSTAVIVNTGLGLNFGGETKKLVRTVLCPLLIWMSPLLSLFFGTDSNTSSFFTQNFLSGLHK
jgi:hypothetical protein